MRRSICVFVVWMAMLLTPSARAYSSRSGDTEGRIVRIVMALRYYRAETGHLPPTQQYWLELERAHMLERIEKGVPMDSWNRPLIYRVPGRHGEFDLYSYGRDGVDNDGQLDDISNWAGINDGFYAKANWPRGRRIIAVGVLLGTLSSLLALRYPWRYVFPLTGFVVSLGTLFGCWWMMQPRQNALLELAWTAAAGVLCATVVWFVVNLRNAGWPFPSRRAFLPPWRRLPD